MHRYKPSRSPSLATAAAARPRQFLLTAIGTRGDSQPLVVMAQRLMADGHVVRVAVHPAHRESLEKQGVMYYPLEGFSPEGIMRTSMGNTPVFELYVQRSPVFIAWYHKTCASTWAAATAPLEDGTPFRAEAILASHQQIGALPAAEALGAHLFYFNTYPMSPTVEFRHPFGIVLEGKDSRGTPRLNALTFWLYDLMQHTGLSLPYVAMRKRLGLASHLGGWRMCSQALLMALQVPCFCIWSPHILPKPRDWHDHLVVCGSVDRTGGLGTLPAELLKFIGEAEPPHFFGFGPGSMSNEEAIERSWAAAVGAIEELGLRAVLHVTPEHAKYVVRLPPRCYLLTVPVPHAALFEMCGTVVHHGGPGTLHAALRAGKPNCIVSFVCDNPFWGDRLTNLRLGSHVPSRLVTTPLLVAALRALQSDEVTEACSATRALMATEENGVDVLVRELYTRLPEGRKDWAASARRLPAVLPAVLPTLTNGWVNLPPLRVATAVGLVLAAVPCWAALHFAAGGWA